MLKALDELITETKWNIYQSISLIHMFIYIYIHAYLHAALHDNVYGALQQPNYKNENTFLSILSSERYVTNNTILVIKMH